MCVRPNGVCAHSLCFNPPPHPSRPPSEAIPSTTLLLSESSLVRDFSNSTLNQSSILTLENNVDISNNHEENNLDIVIDTVAENNGAANLSNDDLVPVHPVLPESSSVNNAAEFTLNIDESNERTTAKKFEGMNENELALEFQKRNMKIGRIKKKDTFIKKLREYEETQK